MALLDVQGVGKRFGDLVALTDVDLTVEDGEIHGLIGPNGAGKSTLLHVIAGATPRDDGAITFDGASLDGDAAARARRGVALQLQIPSVFDGLRVADNLRVAADTPAGRGRKDRLAVGDALELSGLGDAAETPARELSHGQRKWLELAMCVLTQPALLLLDEPTAGMTTAERTTTGELVREVLARGLVRAVLLVEHDMTFVARVCDPVSVLHRGTVLARGDFSTLAGNAAVQEAYLGIG